MKENYKEIIFKLLKQEATGTLEFEALAQTFGNNRYVTKITITS